MELFFDTETSDKINFKTADYTSKDFPWCVQFGAVLAENGIAYAEINLIIIPDGRTIAPGAQEVHNISTREAQIYGIEENLLAEIFLALYENADILVCHNFQFDSMIMAGVLHRQGYKLDAITLLDNKPFFCTMQGTTQLCKLPGKFGDYKWPKLQELHQHLFGEGFIGAHDAMFDIKATMKCYYELRKTGWIK